MSNHHKSSASVQGEPLPPDYLGYFVSYNYASDGGISGYGCIEIGRRQTVRSLEDVMSMADLIKSTLRTRHGHRNPSVVILTWQPFEAPAPSGGKEPVPDHLPQSVLLRLVA